MTLLLASALAGAPSLTGMLQHGGARVDDPALLGGQVRQLVAELGTGIANPALPASTTGVYGFEFGVSATVMPTDLGAAQEPTPWDRADPDGEGAWLLAPALSVRKGLPLSTEVGGSLGRVHGAQTGFASVFGRAALIEGYRPLPDVAIQLGYTGYLGNDELRLGVLDASVTVGGRFELGGDEAERVGRIEPFASFALLRVSARPTVDPATAAALGQVSWGDGDAGPLTLPRVAAGVQFTHRAVHLRAVASWCWTTLPTVTAGMGLTL